MTTANVRTHGGATVEVGAAALDTLRQSVRGAVCLPGEAGYDEARTLWNAMIDRRPGVVVRCAGAADVMRAVTFARDREALLSVRGGGHNIAGTAVSDGGLMIDLTPMKSVRVDLADRTARVEPGVTLGELDHEAQAFGMATSLGINSTTGVAGLTLGGGFGWLSRKYGLTIDNLLSVDLVTAEGTLVHASAGENADLFWGVCGGGGNFGVVTSFEYRLHPIGTEVLSGLVVHPFEKASELFDMYRSYIADLPDEMTCWVVLRKAPPLPFLPEGWHGKEVMIFAACYVGDQQEGEKVMAPLRAFGEPIADVISPQPFAGWQAAFDPLLTPGARNYWKSHNFNELGDDAVGVIIDYAGRLPTPECEIFLAQMGGATNRVPEEATAYPHRDANFVLNVHTRWGDPGQDEDCVGWARSFFDKTAPYATGGVYVNFMPEDESERVTSAYGGNYQRLAALKSKYDPGNLFRLNQNIQPSAGGD